MARTAPFRRRVRQDWAVGQTVSVGFLANLTVVEKVPTPGDYAPDAYVLFKKDMGYATACANGNVTRGTWYRFVPH